MNRTPIQLGAAACQELLALAFGMGLAASMSSAAPAQELGVPMNLQPTEWVLGVKKVLAIRIRFPDHPNVDPITEAELAVAYDLAKQQLPDFSFGQFGLEPLLVVTPTVTMPYASTYYDGKIWFEELMNDARAAAAGLGAAYDSKSYHLDVVVSNYAGSTPGAIAVVGGKGIYVTGGPAKIQAIAHEMGHNLGLPHASSGYYGNATFGPLKPGNLIEYGDTHDLMGDTHSTGGAPKYHFNPIEKYVLGWLPDAYVEQPSASGTYRIHAHDQPTLTAGQKYALRLPHSPQEDLWISFRQQWNDNPWSASGAELHVWNPYIHYLGFSNTSNSIRLDPTPGSPGAVEDLEDATLVIGRTFHDPQSDLYVTPIGKGGTVPESLDLVVNFGPFPANVAPVAALTPSTLTVPIGASVTFTAAAVDGDGDPLAYGWDFGDGTWSDANDPQVTTAWSAAGKYTVSCIVSDMRGGETRKTVVVTVGAPLVSSIGGTVRDDLGNPLAGVHVSNGLNTAGGSSYRGTYTADDGTYTITNLAAGTYTVTAARDYQVFSAAGGWANPVGVGLGGVPEDVVGRDFTRAGGDVSITGRVQSGPFGAYTPGVTVHVARSDGTTVDVVTDASGVWQATVPQGLTTATAISPAGWSSGAAYPEPGGAYPNPWQSDVGGAALDKLNFYFRTPNLPAVGFQAAGSTVFENVGEASVPVSVTRASGSNLYMLCRIEAGGTATGGGVDHFFANGQFVFPYISPPGPLVTQTRSIAIPITDDQIPEANETLILDLVATQVTYQTAIPTHTVTIVDADLTLSATTIAENQPVGTAVGTFSTGSPDLSDTFSYTLVAGPGSVDNGSFAITGKTLRTAESFDFEIKNSYAIRVRCAAPGGSFFEEPAIITVVDVAEGPGRVADGSGPNAPLTVTRDGAALDFAWGASCGVDVTDYGLYLGMMGSWSSHQPLLCSTGGTAALGVTPGAGDVYFLVVPRSAAAEGSYGMRSGGIEIPPSSAPCLASQDLTSCP